MNVFFYRALNKNRTKKSPGFGQVDQQLIFCERIQDLPILISKFLAFSHNVYI